MKNMPLALGLSAVLGLTAASGVIQGHVRNRWGPSQAMLEAARKLEGVPQVFGGPQKNRWQMKSAEPMEPLAVALLECTGYIHRVYQNRQTGEIVSVFVIVGPAGPISAHTPEICFAAQNYTRRDNRQQVAIASDQEQDDHFWALSFKTKNVREDLLRVYYAWTARTNWSAPEDTRFGFVGSPYLYKIQVSSEMPAGSNITNSDTCREFLKDFLPVLRPYLLEPLRE
jgi:hypothetical protein